MSTGELAYLVLVLAAFGAFSVSLYAFSRGRHDDLGAPGD